MVAHAPIEAMFDETAFEEEEYRKYLVAGAHIAFPGIGHVRTDSTNYDWLPVNYAAL